MQIKRPDTAMDLTPPESSPVRFPERSQYNPGNQPTSTPGDTTLNQIIEREVYSELAKTLGDEAKDVLVTVEENVVYLSGYVKDEDLKTRAESAMEALPNIAHVINHIFIRAIL